MGFSLTETQIGLILPAMYFEPLHHTVKRSARRGLRELILCWLIISIWFFFSMRNGDWLLCAIAAMFFAIPLWFIYRLLRFSISR